MAPFNTVLIANTMSLLLWNRFSLEKSRVFCRLRPFEVSGHDLTGATNYAYNPISNNCSALERLGSFGARFGSGSKLFAVDNASSPNNTLHSVEMYQKGSVQDKVVEEGDIKCDC